MSMSDIPYTKLSRGKGGGKDLFVAKLLKKLSPMGDTARA